MANNKAWQVIQTAPFIGGLNTEINDLQDATQYTSDELNMVIKNNGTRSRRLGVDYEEGYKLSSEPITDLTEASAFSTYEWTDQSEGKNDKYIVVQMGGTLYFYRNLGEPFSQAQTEFTVPLEGYAFDPLSNDYKETPVSFASVYGGLFVCSKAIKPFVITALTEAPDAPAVKASVTFAIPTRYFTWDSYWSGDISNYWLNCNPEFRFSIEDSVIGLSQLRSNGSSYWGVTANNEWNLAPMLSSSYTVAVDTDDFGNPISSSYIFLSYYDTGSKYVYQPSAKYYAKVWNDLWKANADPGSLLSHITATAITPFSGEWVNLDDVRALSPADIEKLRKGEAIEFLKLECDEGVIYEGIKIKMESVGYNDGGFFSNPICWSDSPVTSEALTEGYKTPNVDFTLDVKIRDFKGLKDIYHDTNLNKDVDLRYGEAVSTEPFLPYTIGDVEAYDSVISTHCYNLFNQGWDADTLKAFKDQVANQQTIDSKLWTKYPANNYQWFMCQDPSTLAFKPQDLIKTAFGNTRAPSGRGIVSYLKQDRKFAMDSVSDSSKRITVDAIPVEYPRTPYFVDIIAYAGRLWYLSGDTVLYSQVLLDDITKADKCYQEADPTSQKISDLVDTDGGMIQIPELGEGIRFCLVGGALAVVGTESIQLISGGQNNAFTATAYVRGAMQAYKTISPRSFVTTEYGTFFWSDVGVVLLSYQEGFAAQNITETTINTFYQKITEEERKHCVGIYNRAQKQIVWIYGGSSKLNKLLVYDILKNAWTPLEVSTTDTNGIASIVGGISLNEAYPVESIYPLYAEEDIEIAPGVISTVESPVGIVDENNEIVSRILVDEPIEKEDTLYKSALLLCLDSQQSKVTFGNFDNLNCLDWASADLYGPGVNYNSYLVSHPINLDSTAWNKTIPYLLTYFRRTETGETTDGVKIYPSACQGAIQWDWNNSGRAGKWDAQQELYRYEKDTLLDNDYVFSKTRVYGGGRAFKVKLSSKDNNYFIIENVGFNIYGDARI